MTHAARMHRETLAALAASANGYAARHPVGRSCPTLSADSDADTLLAWLRATDDFPNYQPDTAEALWADVASVIEASC
jgi:hypothetical protein